MKKLRMKIAIVTLFVIAAASLVTTGVRANGDDHWGVLRMSADLSTFNEVLPKATGGHGTFRARLSKDGTTLNWSFTFTGLTGPPLFAHIHFAQAGVNGAIMTFLCGGPAAAPPPAPLPKPACPQATSGSFTGSTTAADILPLNTPGSTDQGLNANDFASFLRAIKNDDGYANMHTTRFPGGEIRGQVEVQRRDDRDDDDDDHNGRW